MDFHEENSQRIYFGVAEDAYDSWEPPVCIMSDGAYGLGLFPGDPRKARDLPKWYEPHVKAWTEKSTPLTSLWFWNTEQGFGWMHPFLEEHGWVFKGCNIWDKGINHIAGNCNGKTMRHFPVVTEVCAHYVRKPQFRIGDQVDCSAQDWLRNEWRRTGLPFSKANEACGVRNAATRKYLTPDHNFYFPPAEVFEKMRDFANKHGAEGGKPYFSIDGEKVMTGSQWEVMRGKFNFEYGVTNVWQHPAVRGGERVKSEGNKAFHANQKPLALIERIIMASTDEGDVVWEPFGGMCPSAIIGHKKGRIVRSAEPYVPFREVAVERLKSQKAGD